MSGDAEAAIQHLQDGLKAETKSFAQADTLVRVVYAFPFLQLLMEWTIGTIAGVRISMAVTIGAQI